jgi:hypothetical protein
MGPLAAREDPHRRGPGPQLVPASAVAEQPGQLGDVRFFDPARPVRAARIGAGLIGDLGHMISKPCCGQSEAMHTLEVLGY